jgi:hypothetical protein
MTSPCRRPRRAIVLVSVLAGLALAACGDDSDGDTADEAADATTEESTASLPTTTADAAGPASTAPGATSVPAGGDGEPADRDEWVRVGAEQLGGTDQEFNECLAGAVVDGFGYDQLVESGATPAEFYAATDLTELGLAIPEDNFDPLVAQISECGTLADYFEAQGQFSEVQADCIRDLMDNEQLAEVFVSGLAGIEPSAELQAVQQDVIACASPPATTG